MPVNKSLATSLQKQYGKKKGTAIYYGMEQKGGKTFKKGLKTATKEGHIVAHIKQLKKEK